MTADISEPDWSKIELSDKYDWIDGVSTMGKPFKIGVSKSDSQPPATDKIEDFQLNAIEVKGKTPFDINVHWKDSPPTQGFAIFNNPTSEEIRITSITQYLLRAGPLKYNEFNFTCTESYNFMFYDATGDGYRCNVLWARSATLHFATYFSSNPTIVRVTGK
ncbi:hypothetical protein P154DRAFT_539078 [Amniculicola lignicola CBS 123094]|uniref:Uncharacterized protein n=1 Tax=Amniculicola lignicola CBS 123094 TaxID=1392246 RepID=A0A6A5W1B1_9PLEO|nr:hypothetical protein P154DRAFT_539078 [Amniculicola lignicola CBS 123094]